MLDGDTSSNEFPKPNTRGIERVAKLGANFTPLPDHVKGPEFSMGERAEQVWGMYCEYTRLPHSRKHPAKQGDPIDPLVERLEDEIARLWADPAVAKTVEVKLRASIVENLSHRPALKDYKDKRKQLDKLTDDYFDLERNNFQMRQDSPTLWAMDMARTKSQMDAVKRQIRHIEEDGGATSGEKSERGGGLTEERADLTALVSYERVMNYHRQFEKTGTIMTPSRQTLLEDVIERTSSGIWMQLRGETGSGKTTFAKQASQILNNEPPVIAGGDKFGDVASLIGSKSIDPSGGVYYEFGPLIVALTGCTNSLEMDKAIRLGAEPNGKLLILDELNKFDQDALFGALKIAKTLRGGEEFGYKELPGVKLRMAEKGFALVATMNPASARYERKELDPALDRLFYGGKKTVDYLPMSPENPELYEAFLGILMDDNGRIRIAEQELAPNFADITDDVAGFVRREIGPDEKAHGALYRFALASSEIHNSYNQKENAGKTAMDPGFLEKTVLDMEILVKWITGYKNEIEGGRSLTTYLEAKLHDFYENIDNEDDEAIFKRIFDRYGFDITSVPAVSAKPAYKPITPLEMGYLTPKTKRTTTIIGEEVVPKSAIHISDDGEEIEYLLKTVTYEEDGKTMELKPGDFVFDEEEGNRQFLGIDPQTQEWIFIAAEAVSAVASNPENSYQNDAMVERARELLGKDFLGVEAVRTMQEKLRQKGVVITFDLDSIPASDWNEADLQFAKDEGEMLVLGVESMTQNGKQLPINLMTFQDLFKDGDPDGTLSNLFYYFNSKSTKWYPKENFATGEYLRLGWRFVSKDILQDSADKTWAAQTDLIKKPERKLKKTKAVRNTSRRRTAIEASYDLALYYTTHGERLLLNKGDWTESLTSNGRRVYVWFNAVGLRVDRWGPTGSPPNLGVCASR